MPIWLRNFTYHTIKEYYDELGKQKANPNKKEFSLKGPDISPSYSTKASTK
jgi:hypothetical protein